MINPLLKPFGISISSETNSLPVSKRPVNLSQAELAKGVLERLEGQAQKSTNSWEAKIESEKNSAAQETVEIKYNRGDHSLKFFGNFDHTDLANKFFPKGFLAALRFIILKNRFVLCQLKERKRFSLVLPEANKLGIFSIQVGNTASNVSGQIDWQTRNKAVISSLSGVILSGRGFELPVHRLFIDLDPAKPLLSALINNPVLKPDYVEEAYWPPQIKVPILLTDEQNQNRQIVAEIFSLYAEVTNILENKQ